MGEFLAPQGGHLSLISSVLHGFPLYFFSLLKTSKGAINEMEKLIIDFFWSGGDYNPGKNLVNWKFASPYIHGALGIGSIEQINLALFTKVVLEICFRGERFGGRWWLVFMGGPAPVEISFA